MMKLEDRLKALKGEKAHENPKIHAVTKIDRRHFNKRTPGTGNQPKEKSLTRRGIKAYLDQHINESVKIRVTDPKTGRVREISKPRLIIILEKLFNVAVTDGSPDAMDKWLNRALGRPLQPIGGAEDAEPIHIKVDLEYILEKAYGAKN